MTTSAEAQFKDIKKLALDRHAKVQRAVFLDIAKRCIDMTPVDSGRARGGWNGDIDNFGTDNNAGFSGTPAAAAQKSLSSALAAVGKHEPGRALTLSNNVEYIPYLNQGSSSQAPAGITDVVLANFKNIVAIQAVKETE